MPERRRVWWIPVTLLALAAGYALMARPVTRPANSATPVVMAKPACTPPPKCTPTPTSPPAGSYPVPADIPADCSADVAARLLSWLATVPDNAAAMLGGGCYRVESTLLLHGRSGLVIDGGAGTLRSFNPPDDQRALWRLVDSSSMALRNMTLAGSYASGGTFTPDLQHAHAVDLRGTSADLAGLSMKDLAGDCVYFGLGATRSSGSLRDSTCLRTSRNGVSVTAGDHIRVERSTFDMVGYITVDVEPNAGPGFGSDDVAVTGNLIGSYRLRAYSVIANAPVSRQSFVGNQVTGTGTEWAVVGYPRTGQRPSDVTVADNVSSVPQASPAVAVADVDRPVVTGNTVPLSGGVFAHVDASCSPVVSGNTFPGGTSELSLTSPLPDCPGANRG